MSTAFRKARYKSYRVTIGAVVVLIVLLSILCAQYYRALQSTIKNESHEYLLEIAKQVSGNASRNIVDNFAVLGTIATVLKSAGIKTYKELQPEVLAQQTFWNFKDVLLIDVRGNAYDAYGNIVTLSGDEYLREAVVKRRRSMSPSELIKGTECIVFVIPVQGLNVNGTDVHALAATYALDSFDKILSVQAFSGLATAYIIQKNGATVVRSSSGHAPLEGYNLLNSLSEASLEDTSLSAIKADIAADKGNAVTLTINGKRFYMAYVPLESREWYLAGFVPVDVVNAKSEFFMRVTLLLSGAITLAFTALVAYQMFMDSRHKRRLEEIAYVDPLTKGNTIERFYEVAAELLSRSGKPLYALVYVNVEKFKLLNEEFGRRACDGLLCCIHDGIKENLSDKECLGRLFADNFCALVAIKNEASLEARFEQWYEGAARHQEIMGGMWMAPIIECGVFILGNDSLPFPHMIDRAKLALRETSTELRGKLRYAVYDDAIRRQLFREKHLENMMVDALSDGDFCIFLQPKYKTDSETIGGAEALVRWANPEGMIFPDEFIPLFEKNGFIVQLDLWVFEAVCRRIRAWLDAGITPVKVSVNCSRVHLKNPQFLQRYVGICQKCGISPEFLEIELTENVVFNDVTHLSKIIDEIHKAGFGCSMDDFGSGYSSLNLIRDIPVDTIKLDKVFFRNGVRDLARTESVVGSILAMSRSLGMITVAEGVEERAQVDMLKRLGCDYIQGYFFARPMPVVEFEKQFFGRDDLVQEGNAS